VSSHRSVPVPSWRRRRVRRGAVAGLLALALALAACSSAEDDEIAALLDERGDAATEQVLLRLAEVESRPWWRGGQAVSDDTLRDVAERTATDIDRVAAVAGADLEGMGDAAWEELDARDLVRALTHLMEEPEARDRLARATATWVEGALPATPEDELDPALRRDIAGWARAVDAALEAAGSEAGRSYYRTATLASLAAADARARAEPTDPPWALVGHVHLAWQEESDEDGVIWDAGRWVQVLERFVLAPRWMERDPDVVEELAAAPPPTFDLPDDVVEHWREGEAVADDDGVAALAEAWETWLVDEPTESDLVARLQGSTRVAHPAVPYRTPPPTAPDED
jgi:hypothetical protein